MRHRRIRCACCLLLACLTLVACVTTEGKKYELMVAPGEIRELTARGDVEGLATILANGNRPIERARAAERLGRLGDRRAIEPLAAALDDPAPVVRREAVRALGNYGEVRPADFWLARLAGEPNDAVRGEVILTLGRSRDPRALEALVDGLSRREPAVRRGAATALGALGDRRAVPFLLLILRTDKDLPLVLAATRSLGQLGDARAAAPLTAILRERREALSPAVWRQAAAWSLGAIGGADARAALSEALFKDPQPIVREAAVLRLRQLDKDGSECLYLTAMFDADPLVRLIALRGLSAAGGGAVLAGWLAAEDDLAMVRAAALPTPATTVIATGRFALVGQWALAWRQSQALRLVREEAKRRQWIGINEQAR